MPTKVTVRVPATTANLGPGFDTLGIAVALYNRVTVARLPASAAAAPYRVSSSRAGGSAATRAISASAAKGEPMFDHTAQAFFAEGRVKPFPFSCAITGDVPRSRGLGSSVTVRLGLIAALNRLADEPLNRDEICRLVVRLEGHPDNAAPACYGGFAACSATKVVRVPVRKSLKFIALIPDFPLETKAARAVLPKKISLSDAIHNLQHTALITAAFCAENYGALRGLFSDRVHQPYRAKLIPGFDAILAAAEKAGALGCFLSGAGSTLMALTLDRGDEIARAMQRAAAKHGWKGTSLALTADNEGARF